MAKKYGVTPWGAELLGVLEQKTDYGRLGRGRTYANTGRVYDISIEDNHISAKVEGNYSPYYSTSMDFPPFSKADIDKIKKILDENPLILAEIMNGRLPESFLIKLKEESISLFANFDMHCDCPDFWGQYACKHIAGLYYIAVSEMDKNPFILFSLRGFDLVKEFDIEQEIAVPDPLSLNPWKDEEIDTEPPEIIKLQDSMHFILSMLSPHPPFAPVDYKEVMEEFYKKVPRELALTISPIQNEKIEKIERLFQNADFQFDLNHSVYGSSFKVINPLIPESKQLFDIYSVDDIVFDKQGFTVSALLLFRFFISFEDDSGSQSYRYLFYLFRVAYLMIESRAFIPMVIEEKKSFHIAYRSLRSIPEMQRQLSALAKTAPKMAKHQKHYLDQISSTEAILSVVMSKFVLSMDFMHKRLKSNPPAISLSFFRGEELKIKGFEESNLASSIHHYFALFDIMQSRYRYKIYIDKDELYHLAIKVQDGEKEYLLNQSLKELNKMEILKFIAFLNTHLPETTRLIKDNSVELPGEKLEAFLLNTSAVISNLGVDIILPKELKNLLRPKLALKVSSKSKSMRSFFDLQSMLEYDWQIAIGDKKISVEEFEKLVEDGRELIEFRDNFVVISPEEAKNIFAQIKRKRKLNQFDILQESLSGDAFLDKEMEAFIEELFQPKAIMVPDSLKAKLRDYQERGFAWSINNLLNGFGMILADDMGLGKTIQAISTILYLKEKEFVKRRVVIVVPTSLLNNWENELEKFSPSLSYYSYYGLKRSIKESDILITTYDIIRRDLERFKKEKIDCLVIDEAQRIKNPGTETSKAVKSIKAKYKIALSGTPVENNLSELWSIFDFVLPKYLKSLKDFSNTYAKSIEIEKDRQKIERLRKITAPFMLRRLKTDKDIAPDLPEKIIIDEYSTMTKKQAALYQSVVDESFEAMEDKEKKGALVLKLIVSLKQICNHPRNYDKSSPIDPSLSGKSQQLLTLLDTILQRDEKVLIFTQYTEMGEILVKMIEETLLTTPLYLKGSQSKKKRDEIVDSFQNNAQHKIFILSLKAGGVGLNLTAANHVIHYDLWFNPAVENQATDRAFRIGQNKNVSVYRFITKNSFEEKIDKMIKAKQELSDLSVTVGEKWIGEMEKDELKEIF
ncbi:MAG: DEAD/DEAH box helicase, partial [Campylobacterota bacterium]|nr:DEAD/DEAH box helicase [Campylobacterota bacterium]